MSNKYYQTRLCYVKINKLALTAVFFALSLAAQAQVKLGDNPNTISSSALLELESTNKGLLLPRMTDGQMRNIPTPVAGMVVYNTDSGCAYIYRGNFWGSACGLGINDIMLFITSSPGRDTIIRTIAENAHNMPLYDSLYHAITLHAGDLSSPGGMVSISNGTRSVLRNVTIDVDRDSIVQTVIHSPLLSDSIIRIVADHSNQSPLRDSIFSAVVAQGRNATAIAPISVIGGAGATLQNLSISIDSNRIVPLGGTTGEVLIKGSSGAPVWGVATGDNWGTQVISHDATLIGSGTVASPIGVDTATLATILPVSPVRDTILSIVNAAGQDATATSPIFITGGAGATLQPINVSIDSNRIVPLGGTTGEVLIKGSSGAPVWGVATGDNWGTQVISHDATLTGSGTVASPIGVDTATLATILPVSPVRDTILSIVNAAGQDATATSPIFITGGAGATLQPVNISIDSNRIVPLGGTTGEVLIKGSSGAPVWGVATGDNWGTQVISHDATLTGSGTVASPIGVDTATLATILPVSPVRDTILSIVHGSSGDLTAGSTLVTVTGGTGATLVNATVDVNRDTIINTVINSPLLSDSIIKIVADHSNQSPLRDSIFSTVVAQGRDATAVDPIIISGGVGATLQPMSVSIDTNRIVPLGGTTGEVLIKGSSGAPVWGVASGDNWGTQVISHDATLTGSGTVASPIGVDTATLATILPVSPVRDTILSIVHGSSGNLTAGSTLVTVTGGTDATLVNATVDVNRDTIINTVINSPLLSDSIIKIVADHSNQSPLRDSIFSTVVAQGRDATAVDPIIITGGAGATLQPISVSIDSNRIVPLGGTTGEVLIKGSSGAPVWGVATGDNWGTQVISHDATLTGSGTAASPIGVDTATLATILPVSPVRDTILSIVHGSSGDLTAGSTLVTVTGGTGATLVNATVDVNRDTIINTVINSPLLSDSIIKIVADHSNQSPLRDSIFSTVVAQGRNLTSTTPAIVVTGGTGATLQNTSVAIDSAALISLLIRSHIQDSLADFKGFNVSGTSTSSSFLTLTLALTSSPDDVTAYEPQSLPTSSPFPEFNDFGLVNTTSSTAFTAPVTGYYSLTYSVSLVVNPSVLNAGGIFSWGTALIRNGSTIIQTTRNTQTLSASVLSLGPATVGTNTVTALVKLNAGDKVTVGLGASNGVNVGVLASITTRQHFSGYWVK